MRVFALIRRTFSVLVLAASISVAWAQPAAGGKEYEPEFGQDGKDVIWVPTDLALVNKMLDMAKLTPQDYLIDLGSGDGRTVITAAKRGARAHGIEYNPDLVVYSKRNAAREGVTSKATFEKADIFQSDFSRATVITLFLLPELNVELRPTLLKMKPGTRVVANSFDMDDWAPDQIATVRGDCEDWCSAYLWIVPAKAEGSWMLPRGNLIVKQRFQYIYGSLIRGKTSHGISDGKINGDQISFKADGAQYSGRVIGNAIEGIMDAGGKTAKWSATRARPGKAP